MQVRPGLDMHGDDIGAGLGEGFEMRVAGRDHQMHVEDLFRSRADRLHHIGAKGDVRNEMPVHHVKVDPVGAGRVDGADFLAEL